MDTNTPKPVYINSIEWDGTNQAEIEEAIFSFFNPTYHQGTDVAEDGTLTVSIPYGMSVVMPPGARIVSEATPDGVPRSWAPNGRIEVMTAEKFAEWFNPS